MGGCDGGLAHRWPDLTVPQWPTEEAHRCSLASPPPLPRTPPLSLRPCPAPHPRVTHAHTWSSATRSRRQGLEPAAPGSQRAGGPHLPKVSSSGSLCPAAPRPLLAGPGLAAWPPALPACPPAPSTQHFCSPPPGRPPPAAASPGHLRGGLRLGAVRSPLRAGGGGLSQAAPGLREGWTRAGCRARPNSASPTNPRGSSGGGRRAGGQAVTSGGDRWASSSAWAPSWAPVGPG